MRLYCLQTDHATTVKAPVAPPGSRLAFVSIASFDPTCGLAGADAVCHAEAPAGYSYKALLSTTTNAASSRVDLTGPR